MGEQLNLTEIEKMYEKCEVRFSLTFYFLLLEESFNKGVLKILTNIK